MYLFVSVLVGGFNVAKYFYHVMILVAPTLFYSFFFQAHDTRQTTCELKLFLEAFKQESIDPRYSCRMIILFIYLF
jgi:uncharacterized protein Usg